MEKMELNKSIKSWPSNNDLEWESRDERENWERIMSRYVISS